MPQPTRLDIAYAAGFFDGEGSITIGLDRGKYLRLEVSSSQNLPPVLFWHVPLFGGKVYHPAGHASQWKIYGAKAIPFLIMIQPYLIVKAVDVEETLNIWQAYKAGRKEEARTMIEERKVRRADATRLSIG